jgi:hypothetical protein
MKQRFLLPDLRGSPALHWLHLVHLYPKTINRGCKDETDERIEIECRDLAIAPAECSGIQVARANWGLMSFQRSA